MIKKRLIAENRIIKDNFKAEQEKVKTLLEERDSLHEEISRLKEELCKDNGYKNSLCQGIYEFLAALPIIRALSGIIFTISERSILELTEDTFSLSQSSKDVGDNIKTLLESLCTGDKSLGKDMAVLFSEIKQFESLLVRFQGIKGSYTEEMRLLSDMVKGINTYTEEIADIAERTSILAINASIEAARVGEKGKGFAVIAGEVQKLSARTKSISESINTNLRNTTLTFNASYKSQSEAIEEAVGIMGESKRNLTDVSYSMEPKLTVIEASVKDAEGLSKIVTSKIERVTKSLQFQDKIRQILEHIGMILSTIEDSTREKGLNPEKRINAGEIDSRVREKALNTFTVSEEWEALGVKINTSFTGIDGNGKDKELAEKEIKGDVTLF